MDQSTPFVVVVSDPLLRSASVYPAIFWQEAAQDQATVNMWAWIGGSIAAVLIIIAVVAAILVTRKYRKIGNVYQNIAERPVDMF